MGVADVLSELVCWIPSNLTNWLFAGGALSMAAGWGALGAALPGAGITQAIVAPALWIAAASALILAIGASATSNLQHDSPVVRRHRVLANHLPRGWFVDTGCWRFI